jgi:hypothetical protein
MKIKVISLEEINNDIPNSPIKIENLKEYLDGGREDVLINPDIFFENVRTINKKDKNFSLFERTNYISDDVIIVFSIYLELFEYFNKSNDMLSIIRFYSEKYSNNTIIFYWNHDIDFSKYNSYIENLDNVFIINYNTSLKSKNDIIVPFWTYSDKLDIIVDIEKNIICNFIGTINNELRLKIFRTFKNKDGYYIEQKIDYNSFVDFVSKSNFTFCPRGLGLSSYRFFECMFLGSIPVLFADDIILPYEDIINYNDMIIRIPESKALDFEFINDKLSNANIIDMKKKIQDNIKHFRLDGIQEYVYQKIKLKVWK